MHPLVALRLKKSNMQTQAADSAFLLNSTHCLLCSSDTLIHSEKDIYSDLLQRAVNHNTTWPRSWLSASPTKNLFDATPQPSVWFTAPQRKHVSASSYWNEKRKLDRKVCLNSAEMYWQPRVKYYCRNWALTSKCLKEVSMMRIQDQVLAFLPPQWYLLCKMICL